jgi:hypothetical protein
LTANRTLEPPARAGPTAATAALETGTDNTPWRVCTRAPPRSHAAAQAQQTDMCTTGWKRRCWPLRWSTAPARVLCCQAGVRVHSRERARVCRCHRRGPHASPRSTCASLSTLLAVCSQALSQWGGDLKPLPRWTQWRSVVCAHALFVHGLPLQLCPSKRRLPCVIWAVACTQGPAQIVLKVDPQKPARATQAAQGVGRFVMHSRSTLSASFIDESLVLHARVHVCHCSPRLASPLRKQGWNAQPGPVLHGPVGLQRRSLDPLSHGVAPAVPDPPRTCTCTVIFGDRCRC